MIWFADKCKVKDLKLNKKKLSRDAYEYYLTAVIEHEDKAGVYETVIPHIELPVYCREIKLNSSCGCYPDVQMDLGFGLLDVIGGFNEPPYTTTKIKDKTQKMTLAEIEKKLGHKIELVSEKE